MGLPRIWGLKRAARTNGNESGQTLIMFALMLTVLVSLVGLAADAGLAFREKAHSQSAADAAVLASVQVLVSEGEGDHEESVDEAFLYAESNGFAADQVNVNIPPVHGAAAGDDGCVEVMIATQSNAYFTRVLGFEMFDVASRAVACGDGGEPFTGIMPWAVEENAINYDGSPTTMKYDSSDPSSGNFGSLRLFGSGSKDYEENIKFGVEGSICAQSQPSCTEPWEETETGNMVGGTRDGVNYRLANTSEACDAFEEVFAADGLGGYDFIEECDPFAGAVGSNRVLLVPVIDNFCNGHCTVTLKYFVLMFLSDLGECNGNSCEVTGTFVQKIEDPEAELAFTPGELIGGEAKLVE